jgi:serine/threonine protein kinase
VTRQPTKFGKYLLLERIAVGGMAEVFVAKAFGVEGFERLLAIKKILPTMGEDEEFISMFVDEARIAVQLSHANIVQVLELGKHDENLYIAMEYISGRDVRQLLERFRKRKQAMPIPQAALIAARICEALDYAHRKRDARGAPLHIVHRDVSPQNVLVSFEGEVKLIDFGIAKAESRLQKTQAGILKGKFAYMSPEQVRGQSIDGRSDIFAAGVLLWEMLCGEKLFTGDSDFAILEKVRSAQVPDPRSLNRQIPEALERVMMKALTVEPNDRYQTASELHDELMRFTLVGDMMYGARQLAEWVREEFRADFEKEQGRLRSWLGVEDHQVEVTPSEPVRRKVALIEPSVKVDMHADTPLDPFPGPAILAAAAAVPTTPETEPTQQWRVPIDADTLVPAPPPPPRPLSAEQELPTMKMDGEALIKAEREFAARKAREQKQPPLFGGAGDDDEPTAIDDQLPSVVALDPVVVEPAAARPPPPPAVSEPEVPKAPPARAPARPAAPLSAAPARAEPSVAPARPPAPRTPPRGTAKAPVITAELDISQLGPPSGLIFDNSDEPTGLVRLQRKGAMTRAVRDQPKQKPERSRKWMLFAVPALLAALVGGWLLLGDGEEQPGKVIVTPSPSVQADLFIDGKAAGALPPFVHNVPPGRHKLEVKAEGYKTFSVQVHVAAGGRPVEVDAQLQADKPMEVEGVVLTQPRPAEPEPEPEPAAKDQPPATPKKKSWWAARKEKKKAMAAAAQRERPAPVAEQGARLRIVTDPPGADITVDGRPVGKSPVTTDLLNAGSPHPVIASLDGYSPARRSARLDGDGVTELRLSLSQQEAESSVAPVTPTGVGYLTAATKPAARVTIDGRETGRWTPVPPANPIALPAGAHTIVFETAEGKKLEEQLQVEVGKTSRLIRSFP